MILRIKNIRLILFSLFLILQAERAIPHHHIEYEGKVIPDWIHDDHDSHPKEEGDELHSSHYQLTVFNYQINLSQVDLFHNENNRLELKEYNPYIEDYNILPKIFSSTLFIIHTYSSKSPPLFV
jgi:hypothetical protein